MKRRVSLSCATMPTRETALRDWVAWAMTQPVDHVRVYFDRWPTRPDWLPDGVEVAEGSARALGKLHWCEDDALHVVTDDDILYPPDYVARTLEGLERHPLDIVCHHGGVVRPGYRAHYSTRSRQPYVYHRETPERRVHIPGTGTMAFDSRAVAIRQDHYTRTVGIDSETGVIARMLGAEVWVLAHPGGWMVPNPRSAGPSLVRSSVDGDRTEYDTAEAQSRTVLGAAPWPILPEERMTETDCRIERTLRAMGLHTRRTGAYQIRCSAGPGMREAVLSELRERGIPAQWRGRAIMSTHTEIILEGRDGPPVVREMDDDPLRLDGMTGAELRALARDRGVPIPGSARRVDEIREHLRGSL